MAAIGALSAPQVDFDNSIDLTMPSLTGVPTDGSAMIVAVLRPSAGPVASTGSVFTAKRTGADANMQVLYKRVAGGEAATYNFTCAAFNIFSDARSFVVTGIPTSGDPFDVAPVQNFVSAAASTALSLTTATANCLLIFVDAHNNDTSASTSSAPSGMTTRGGNPTQLHVFDQVQAAAGATGNKIHTTTVSVNHYACLMAIKPGSQTVSPGGVASTSALGTPTITSSLTLSPGGIASTSAVGSPTVQPGSVTVSPSGIGSSSAVGTPTVTPGSFTVSPGGIGSTSGVGAPTVTPGSVTVSPGGIDSTATVGTPTVQPGAVTVSPGGVDSTALLGNPTVTAGQFTVSPGGIDSTALLGSPTVVPGSVTVSPGGIDSTALLGSPTVIPGAFTVEPPGIDSTALLGTPTVLSGFVTVHPSGIGPTSGVGTPAVEAETLVSGTVFNHETGDPVGAGIEVKLFDDNDVLVATTVTDASGGYVFYRPFGDTGLYWALATYEIAGVQYHGVSDRGCPAV